jgi:hypothetical protein
MLAPAQATVRPRRPVTASTLDAATGSWSAAGGCGDPVDLRLPPGGAVLLEVARRRPGRDC